MLLRLVRSVHTSRKVNIGSMTDYLRAYVPQALQVVPDSTRLSPDITLRVAPSIHNVPMIKGHMSYITTLRATQLILTTFVLHPDTQLQVVDLHVDESDVYGVIPGSTKVVVKWQSCQPQGADKQRRTSHQHKILSLFMSNPPEPEQRFMSGVFVFELNKDCDLIMVHNLENIEFVDREELMGLAASA